LEGISGKYGFFEGDNFRYPAKPQLLRLTPNMGTPQHKKKKSPVFTGL
jgi:hypothetical protein